jgi:hypothetical protein
MKGSKVLGATMVFVLAHAAAFAAADPAVKCESGKLKEVGKYFSCRLKADATAAKKSEDPDYSRCEDKFQEKYTGMESKAGAGVCPTENNVSEVEACVAQAAVQCAALAQGSGSGGGGGGTCDNGDCNSCYMCAQDEGGQCSDEVEACFMDGACNALVECFNDCTDEACFDACYDSHSAGQALYNAAIACLDGACTDSCGGGGGNTSCDVGTCDACLICAEEPGGVCADELDACGADPACEALVNCQGGCEDSTCAQQCYQNNPGGQAEFDAVVDCLTSTCPTTCG